MPTVTVVNGDALPATPGAPDSPMPLRGNQEPQPLTPLDYAKVAKLADCSLLFLSIAMCAVAFFMLRYSIQLYRMVAKGEKDAPDADSGWGLSFLLLLLFVAASLFFWLARNRDMVLPVTSGQPGLNLWPILGSLREFAPAFMLASIAPSIIALCKFSFAIPMLRGTQPDVHGTSRQIGALIVALLSLINLASNLISFYQCFFKSP
jgi:cobalamin synthase